MDLHNDSGEVSVIIDVTYTEDEKFIDFILNEQCQFIDSLGVEGLLKFEWFVDEDAKTATLVEVFDKAESWEELAEKAIGTPVNLKFRELATIEKMTVLGEMTENLKTNLAAMNPVAKSYKGCLLYTSPSPRDRTRSRMPSSA